MKRIEISSNQNLVCPNCIFSMLSYLWIFIIICCSTACKKQELIPIAGTYVGDAENRKWAYKEILDNDGNMLGVEQTRDTLYTKQDKFLVIQGDEDNQFTISGEGTLIRLNGFSRHIFTYEGQNEFSIVDESDPTINKRLAFTFDGVGNVIIQYYEENMSTNNRPPIGQEIDFQGIME